MVYETEIIGRRIKELRKNRGDTQKQLANKIGTSQEAIANWENHLRVPTSEYIAKIALEYKVSADWILGIENDTESNDNSISSIAKAIIIMDRIGAKIKIDKNTLQLETGDMRVVKFYEEFEAIKSSVANNGYKEKLIHLWVKDYIKTMNKRGTEKC